MILYAILKFVIRIAIRVFFRRIEIRNQDLIPTKGPLIVVSNHPNTIMDALIVGCITKPPLHFLAKGSVFTSKFRNWFFRKLFMIPIYRKADDPSLTHKNKDVFQACYDFLGGGGTLLIFPEGVSYKDRRLQKVKTGTARIALATENNHDFNLGLQIVTIGLNYSNPSIFRSELFVNVDKVIKVNDFKATYEADNFEAAQALTAEIKESLATHTIDIPHPNLDDFVVRLETLYKDKLLTELGVKESAQEFLVTKEMVKAITYFNQHQPKLVETLAQKTNAYFTQLNQLKLKDKLFAKDRSGRSLLLTNIKTISYIILGFPLFLYGWLNNLIPYKIPGKVAPKLTPYEEYFSTIKLFLGTILFPLFYTIQILLCYYFIQNIALTIGYGLSLPLTGFFALYYWERVNYTKDYWKLLSLFYSRQDLVGKLIKERTEIMELLEAARKEYSRDAI